MLNIINITTDTLASVLQRILPKNTAIDFMSIDIEGFELKALKSNDWTKYRPKILLIEILNFDVDRFKENLICSYLKEQGYKLIAKTKNTVFFEDNILV